MKKESFIFSIALIGLHVHASFTLIPLESGWYRTGGDSVHEFDAISGELVITGLNDVPTSSAIYRGYYIFDLSLIPGGTTFQKATIELVILSFVSIDNSESYRIYDANADNITDLGGGFKTSDPHGTYDDLGSGNAFGEFTVDEFDSSAVVPLNNLALDDLESKAGSFWAIGFDFISNNPIMEDERVRFSQADANLILTIPEPQTYCFVFSGAILIYGIRINRNRRRKVQE